VRSAYILNKKQHQSRVRQSPLELSSVNRIFVDNSVTVSENLQTILFDEIEKIDFRYQPKDTRQSTPEDKSDVSMVLIMPTSSRDSVDDVISRLNADNLKLLVERTYAREMEVSLPKFQFEQRLGLTPVSLQIIYIY